MENKWVTLAIRTYQRAQMIKARLEQNGIATVIHNLNLENPEMAVGVRVRIKEIDLPRALGIVEEMEKAWEDEVEKTSPSRGSVLIPVELTDQINEICKFGFHFAKKLKTDVVFLHAYLTPAYTISSASNTEINTYSLTDAETLRRIIRTNNADVDNLTNLIKKWIATGEIPKVKFRFELKEGVAEDEILSFCKKESPSLVVMGTHSKENKSSNIIGSVTAEVLESSRIPVLAITAGIDLKPADIKRVGFLTNFDQKDLIAIDTAISFFKKEDLEIVFIHATEKKESWDEVMLAGIKVYFANHYPNIKMEYAFLKKDGNLNEIQQFLETSNIDIVAINTKKRSLFARFFNQGFATKLLFNVDTPLFVMHM
ncbi:MAG: universal stress protein [Porphyromonadaceae bacterium]|nr:universal stress protein [Porphyromonadaceae bacterium]